MIVWEQVLKNKYFCSVERIELYRGKVVIRDHSSVVHSAPVILSYSNSPEKADITTWQDYCEEWIDENIL